jgi:hypothetical protein
MNAGLADADMFMLVTQGSTYFEKLLSLWFSCARGSPAVIVLLATSPNESATGVPVG